MASCDVCGTEESMPYECHRCGGTYCSDHRLPEHHDCRGLTQYSGTAGSGRFDNSVGSTTSTTTQSDDSLLEQTPSPGGLSGYFRNNTTYVFLLLIWVTFLLQQLVRAIDPTLHGTVFVLEANNLHHVWSYVTSVFAHSPDGLAHVGFNSLVLYFFGPQLERVIGSKRFSVLFLGSGVIAGVATALVYTQLPIGTGSLGASGAVLGVLGALAMLNPSMRVMLLIPPVPVSLQTLVGVVIAVSVLFIAVGNPFALGINHIAHLVGLLIGVGYGYRLKQQGGLQPPQQVRLGAGRGPGRGRL